MLVQQPATPIHVLESQLAALQHTKADMYELREHMAGLEDELNRCRAELSEMRGKQEGWSQR